MATLLRADPTFYASPRLAMQAPPETVAYVIVVNPGNGPDGLAVPTTLNEIEGES